MIRPRRLLALTAVVTATFALLGHPANAAPDGEVMTNLFFRHLTLPAGGPTVDEYPTVFLTSDKAGWANEVTLSIDTSAVATVADVAVNEATSGVTCSPTGSVVRCTVPGPHRIVEVADGDSFGVITSPSVTISLTPKPGATAGDAGALTVSAQADDGPTTTRTSTVRIGEGVNLTAIDAGSRSVAPGGSVALRPQVRNTGPREVKGLTLVVSADESALADTSFGNCTYDYAVACTFDTPLAVGQTYQVSAPFTVHVPADAAVGSETGLSAQWLTLAEWQDWQAMFDGLPSGRQGTGPDLELGKLVSASAAGVPQADIDGDDNGTHSTVTVTGGRRADVVAVGATITGSPGEARTIDVGLVNRGPGTLHYPPFVNNLPSVDVTLPSGLSVVRSDERCSLPSDDDDFDDEESAGPAPSSAADVSSSSGPAWYSCTPDSVQLRPGQRLSFAFTVRVADGARDGKGSIEVAMYDGEESVDRDAGNNNAPITLRLGGEGGGLPVTGTTTTATAAGGGILLVLVGVAVTVVLRRRTRFVA